MRKPIIGLAGGICAGKSLVGKLLGQLGCATINADEINRQLLDQEPIRQKLCKLFGDKVLGSGGQVDHHKLADLVFRDDRARKQLEQLMHPLIGARQAELIRQYQGQAEIKAIVIDAPLLFELDLQKQCDKLIFVDARRTICLARARQRGWEQQELARREKKQLSLALKRKRCDYILDNNSSIDACRSQVEKIFSRIISSTTCRLCW